MKRSNFVLGTAGHIDHGKTALVRALTGIDTDRLLEEKRRGITIELGFAHLTLDDAHFAIIDVPGHERFIKTMVAGASGIDLVMLVIAADEGIMPQTEEHLAVCRLLGVKRGVIVLSKADLVEPDWLALVTEEIRRYVRGTFLEQAPIVACSTVTGHNLDLVKQTLYCVANTFSVERTQEFVRLPIDRVFTLKGFGTIVTGTLIGGTLSVGDSVTLLPSNRHATVRNLHVHNQQAESSHAGQRTAINLAGIDWQELSRGDMLVHSETFKSTAILDVEIELLSSLESPLRDRARLLFHHGTRQIDARCYLASGKDLLAGETAIAQLRLAEPIVALPEDRFILRGFKKQKNYGTTLGGGRILRGHGAKTSTRTARERALVAELSNANLDRRIEIELFLVGKQGLTLHEIATRFADPRATIMKSLHHLVSQGKILRYDQEHQTYCHRDLLLPLEQFLLKRIDDYHTSNPLGAGIGKEELRSQAGLHCPPKLIFTALKRLETAGLITLTQQHCRRVGVESKPHETNLSSLTTTLVGRCREAGLAAPREAELIAFFPTENRTALQNAIRWLTDRQQLIRVGDLLFHVESLALLEQKLVAHLTQHETITAQEFKHLVGQTRKYAIPLAEYFDKKKVTLRVGEVRKLRATTGIET